MFEQTGVPSAEMIMRKFPTAERINRGKVAVVECYKRIPCNPCQTACRFGAIEVGSDINNIPELDAEACTGCGLCVSRCPGLAIMIVDGSADPQSVDIQIPYEFLPLPERVKRFAPLTVPELLCAGRRWWTLKIRLLLTERRLYV